MFLWNVEKCLALFDEVYVSSDSHEILRIAQNAGAIPITRGEELCGDTPDIDVYLHAVDRMVDPKTVMGVVAVHANNPTVHPTLIARVKYLIEIGAPEVMTCYPMSQGKDYHKQHNKIYGSIRGMSLDRLRNYGDPYHPNPEILLVDTSIEIETPTSYNKALCQFKQA
jgi:CMP-N-acetylneuraminic acid synthetase